MLKIWMSISLLTMISIVSSTQLATATVPETPGTPTAQRDSNSVSQGNFLEDLVTTFKRRPPPRGSRGNDLCAVSPGLLEDVYVVWNDRPLFLWNGSASQVVVRDTQDSQLWQQAVTATAQSIIYNGKPLQPGQLYEWRLRAAPQEATNELGEQFFTFKVMAAAQRQQIAADLQGLSKQLQAKRATPEAIAIAQANYFANRGLWSDALQALYAVKNPSASLTQAKQAIVGHFCKSAS